MSTTAGTISVIMACYNSAGTLEKAIESIRVQTYTDWVMICCDDGSTDGTWEILQRYANAEPERFTVFRNDRNRRLPYSLNECLKRVRTDLVARMDADDLSVPERFAVQTDYLRSHPGCDLLGTGIRVSDGTKTIASLTLPPKPEPCDLHHCNAFSHATILTYKRVYDALNGYSLDPLTERMEDIDLWARFFNAGFHGENIPDELYIVIENHAAARRRTLESRIRYARNMLRIYRLLGIWTPRQALKKWLGVLKYFVPFALYHRLHLRSIARRTARAARS